MEIKYIDLFAGIGGMRLGLESACNTKGYTPKCILTSEIKRPAIEVLQENFKEPVQGDIKEITLKEDFDILLGGFPCQAFSSAGKRMGFEDARGTLFFEIARILKESKPKGFLLENVRGLLWHDKGKTIKVIENTLHELGYNTQILEVDGKDYHTPQSRKRILILGKLKEYGEFTEYKHTPQEKDFKEIREYGKPVEDTSIPEKLKELGKPLDFLKDKRIRDTVKSSKRVVNSWDINLYGKVDEIDKQILTVILEQNRIKENRCEELKDIDRIPLTLDQIYKYTKDNIKIDKNELKRRLDKLVEQTYLAYRHPRKQRKELDHLPKGYKPSKGYLSQEFSEILGDKEINSLTAVGLDKVGVIEEKGLRQLTELELKRLFTYPDNFKIPETVSRREMLELFGNTVIINCIESASEHLLDNLKMR